MKCPCPIKDACKRKLDKSHINRMIKPPPKKKLDLKKIFEKAPPNSHTMPNGDIMSGKTHSKASKLLGKLKKKRNKNPYKLTGKGKKKY